MTMKQPTVWVAIIPLLLFVLVATRTSVAQDKEAKQDNAKSQEVEPLKVGDQAPDFAVTGIDGKKFKLSDKIGDDGKHVILLFSRANW